MKRHYVYPAIFHPENKGFSVTFPDLKGCQSQGDTLVAASLMAQEALGMYLEYLIENGKNIKEPSFPQALSVIDNDFVAMISADIFVYKDKANNKPIKKTLSIPSWLNEEAEKQHLNFSSILKDALMERITDK